MSMNGVPLLGIWFTYVLGSVIVTVFARVVTVNVTTAPSGGSPLASQAGNCPLVLSPLTVVARWSATGPVTALIDASVVPPVSPMGPLEHGDPAAHGTSDWTMSNAF